MTNTCEIVCGKSDAEFGLCQETLQRPLRIYLKGLCWICVVLYMQGLIPHMTAQFSCALTHVFDCPNRPAKPQDRLYC